MTARDRNVVMVVAILAVLGAFWFLFVGPKRKDAASLSTQIAAQQQRLDQARSSVTQAQSAKQRYDADYAAVARLGQAVPADDDVPSLVYQIDQAAKQARIDFRSLKLNGTTGSAAPAAAPPPAAAPAAAAATGSGSGSSGGSGTPDAAAPAQGTASPTQAAVATLPAGASVGSAGFPTMPFTFAFEGSFFDLEGFLASVANFTEVSGQNITVHGRLLAVDSFQLTAGRKGFPQIKAIVNATAYLLPAGEGLTAGATANGPAATTASATGSGTTTPAVAAPLTSGGTP